MNNTFTQNAAKEGNHAQIAPVRSLWSGWAASVLIVVLATIAVEAVPHTRGIGFFPALRYAIVMPLCVLITVASGFLYGTLRKRPRRPRWALTLILLGFALIVLSGLSILGHGALLGRLFRRCLRWR